MKTLILLVVSALPFYSHAQTTTSILINGRVKAEKTISLSDLEKLPLENIGDLPITNHKGDLKGTAKGMKGVKLSTVLQDVALDNDQPRTLSEYYFTAIASDGYKVVFSWNELFNSPAGESIYVVLEKDGKRLAGDSDAILMVASKDLRTGRRYLKNLTTITAGRAN